MLQYNTLQATYFKHKPPNFKHRIIYSAKKHICTVLKSKRSLPRCLGPSTKIIWALSKIAVRGLLYNTS